MAIRVRASVVALMATVLALAGAGTATAAPTRPDIEVRGGDLFDASRSTTTPLQLRGVNRSGTETACTSASDGPLTTERGYAIFDGPDYDSVKDANAAGQERTLDAMQAWGVNAVRIPLSDACWSGKNPALNTKYSGAAYQRAIVDYVDRLGRRGMVAILSLHVASTTSASNIGQRSGGHPILLPMPQQVEGSEFWKDVVQQLTTASTPLRNVIYDVFNEPHLEDSVFTRTAERADPWSCWRDGGCTLIDPTAPAAPAGGPPATYTSAGMQSLVSAIRAKESDTSFGGTPRPIMLGGLDYANDLSGWSAHLPTDPKNALVASFHVYGGTTRCVDEGCWKRTLGSIRTAPQPRPVVTGEVGQYDCRSNFVKAYTDWADRRTDGGGAGVSYLAWTWNATLKGSPSSPGDSGGWKCDHGPSLLKFNDGTPTDAYGLGYCQLLQRRLGEDDPRYSVPQTTGPCPATRVASDPPADATPVPPPVTTPPPATTPTTTGSPAPAAPAPAADPGPFTPPVTTPVTPTTPAAPVVPPRAGAAEPRNVRITSPSLKVRRGKVAVKVSCAAGRTRCAGRITVRTAAKVALGRRRAVLVVLRVPFGVPAGRSATIAVAPTGDGRKLLRAARRVRTVATVTSMGDLPTTKRLTLTR